MPVISILIGMREPEKSGKIAVAQSVRGSGVCRDPLPREQESMEPNPAFIATNRGTSLGFRYLLPLPVDGTMASSKEMHVPMP